MKLRQEECQMKKKPFFSKMEKRIMAIVGMAWEQIVL